MGKKHCESGNSVLFCMKELCLGMFTLLDPNKAGLFRGNFFQPNINRKCQKFKKLKKIANVEEENLHIFWTTWGMWMTFSGKMWLVIILEVTKNQNCTFSPENVFFEKPKWRGSNWPPAFLGLIQAKLSAGLKE